MKGREEIMYARKAEEGTECRIEWKKNRIEDTRIRKRGKP